MDLGPGPLTVTSDSPFFLSAGDWAGLSNYTALGASLPIQEMWVSGLGNSFPQFCQIAVNAYDHCVNWVNAYAPAVRQLAADVAAWAEGAPTKYANLQSAATAAASDPDLLSQLTVAIQALASDATQYEANAKLASEYVQTFIDGCRQDQTDINDFLQSSDFAAFAGYCNSASTPLPGQMWTSLHNMAIELGWTDGPMQSLGRAEGAWAAIQGALNDIAQQATAPAASEFLAGIRLDTAIDEWRQVGAAAEAFLSNTQAAAA
jgi:hypothetical protein